MIKKECDNCGDNLNFGEGVDMRWSSQNTTINLCDNCFNENIKPILDKMEIKIKD